MSTDRLAAACEAAAALGREHAQNAASWTTDGNTSPEWAAAALSLMQDGDPAVWDVLPNEPNLSGEWADDLNPYSLADAVDLGINDMQEGDLDAVCEAYTEAVAQTFGPACEAALIVAAGGKVTSNTLDLGGDAA